MSPTKRARFKRRFIGVRPWTRHSLVLLIAGMVYICLGFVYVGTPMDGPTARALISARDWWSLDTWGIIWMIVGGLAIISSKWPPVAEKWGYMALTALAGGWGAFYILGVIFGPNTLGGAAVGLVFWLIAFMWWAISGLISPETIEKIVGSNGRG
jgi:hypothetical protein